MSAILPKKGTYIVAVSGGVDSVVLLDMLARQDELKLIVCHVDHGIRSDSGLDEALVKQLAALYGLPYETIALRLERNTNEIVAREKRYEFLQLIRRKYLADGIITAHHFDDVIETIVLNHIRGGSWRSMVSLRSTPTLQRPLLTMTKDNICAYARIHILQWREDSTNNDIRYTRNYIRHQIFPRLKQDPDFCNIILELWREQLRLRQEIENSLGELLQTLSGEDDDNKIAFSRYDIIMLPRIVAREILYEVTIRTRGSPLLWSQIESILLFAKVARNGRQFLPASGIVCIMTNNRLIVASSVV